MLIAKGSTRRRLAALGAPLLALFVGAGAVFPQAAMTASGAPAPRATKLAQRTCPPGTVAERDVLTESGASAHCKRPGSPETYADVVSQRSQELARRAAPFTRVASGAYRSAVAEQRAMPAAGAVAGSAGTWTPAGPTPLCTGKTTQSTLCPLKNNDQAVLPADGEYTISLLGHRTLSGRVTDLAADPANPSRIFAAAAVGGIFETTDGGTSWHSIADALPTQAMGAVAYDAPLHRLFAGTGDNSFSGTAIMGMGVFYTDDNGRTWYQSDGLPDLLESFKIVVSPDDPTGGTVYAATSLGLFRSTDGGRSFSNVNLPTSPDGYTVPDPNNGDAQVSCAGKVDVPLCFFSSIVTDVVVKKDSSANAPAGSVMAVVGWRAGDRINKKPDGTNNMACRLNGVEAPCRQAPRNGLYLSSTGDPDSFTFQSHTPTPANASMDFAHNSIVGRTTLGIADGAGQRNDVVYALVQDAKKFQGCAGDPLDSAIYPACGGTAGAVPSLLYATVLDGAYATYDFGRTWTKVMNFSQLPTAANTALVGLPGYSPGVQSWYNNWVKPDPTTKDASGNPTRVLFGLEEIWENNPAVPGVLRDPWVAHQEKGPASPWEVIGRYWNDCGALNATAGYLCNPSLRSSPIAGSTTHPDQHGYLFVPDPGTAGGVTFYAGNDGGMYKQHVARGAQFSNDRWGDGINTGLYTLQPYDAAIASDGTIVAGLQDNGEMKISPDGKEAHVIFGGDGFWSAIHPTEPKKIVEEYTFATLNLTLNGGNDWYGIGPGACTSSESLFSSVIEHDTTMPGHVFVGCTRLQEATDVFKNPCTVPPGADPWLCQVADEPFTTVFDLGTADNPGKPVNRNVTCNLGKCVFNVPSAVGVRGANAYVGFCGYCDIVTGGLPFNSGIATNVGGAKPPKIGTGDGWHIAPAACANCETLNGKLPKRYITSIQQDPADARTVYVTMGGYGRRWIPPGSLGDDVSNVGVGHVFVSRDAGNTFTDITGNLPDIPANYLMVRNGQLVVATDLGVYIAPTLGGQSWGVLGGGLPNAPVFTIRLQPGNPNRMIAATFGRGVWQYNFPAPVRPAP
jgi:hypothetical protein